MEMQRGRPLPLGVEQRSDVTEHRGLPLVARLEAPSERHLVETDARLAGGARQRGQGIAAALVLGHRQGDPLLRLERQRPVAKLGAEPRVGTQRRGRAGQHTHEVGKLPAARQRTLEDREAPLRRGEIVVDLEPALLSLHWQSLLYVAYER